MHKKLYKDEQGLGHVLVVVLVLVVIAAIGVVGWKVANHKKSPSSSGSSNTSSSSSTGSQTANSSCLSTYHDSNLCKFEANSLDFEKTAYTATITETQSGSTSKLTLENDGKGNTELSGTSNGQTLNTITLDSTTYVQTSAGGTWIEYPSGSSAPTTDPTSNMNIGVGASGITYKALGTEACGSLTCFKYQVTDSSMTGATQYAWFDNSSYLLREWSYTDGSGNSTDMTITYGNVNITKPSPVESFTQAE